MECGCETEQGRERKSREKKDRKRERTKKGVQEVFVFGFTPRHTREGTEV